MRIKTSRPTGERKKCLDAEKIIENNNNGICTNIHLFGLAWCWIYLRDNTRFLRGEKAISHKNLYFNWKKKRFLCTA